MMLIVDKRFNLTCLDKKKPQIIKKENQIGLCMDSSHGLRPQSLLTHWPNLTKRFRQASDTR